MEVNRRQGAGAMAGPPRMTHAMDMFGGFVGKREVR